jgi:hypothetical protein
VVVLHLRRRARTEPRSGGVDSALLPLILVCTVPFVLAVFPLRSRERTTRRVYFSDLVGAAVGCVLVSAFLDATGDARLTHSSLRPPAPRS